MYTQEELNTKVHELRELQRMAEELSEQIESIKNDLKEEMDRRGVVELTGDDWKITWYSVISNRFSQSEFKKRHPEIFEQFLRESSTRRFLLS